MSSIKKILVFDVVLEDRIYRIDRETYDDVSSRFGLDTNGGKKPLSPEAMQSLFDALAPCEPHIARGGSGSTMAFTLKGLFPHLNIRFGGVLGGTPFADTIDASFRNAGIELFSPVASDIGPRHAVSAMIVAEDGRRTIATDSGTFGQHMTLDVLKNDLLRNYDVIHLLATNCEDERLGRGFVEELLKQRWDHGKALWFNFPTHKEFAQANGKYFQDIVPSVNLAFGNMDEIRWTYHTNDAQEALRGIQNAFRQNVLLCNNKAAGNREQAAFITDDARPAYFVTADRIVAVPAKHVPEQERVNTGGAGDTGLATFTAAYVFGGLDLETAARMAHTLSAHKIRQLNPCLDDPRSALFQVDANLAEELYSSSAPYRGAKEADLTFGHNFAVAAMA